MLGLTGDLFYWILWCFVYIFTNLKESLFLSAPLTRKSSEELRTDSLKTLQKIQKDDPYDHKGVVG